MQLGTIGLEPCIQRRRRPIGLEGTASANYPKAAVSGLACSSYLCGAGLPIYWNKMPHSGVQLKLDRSGGVTVFCGCTEIGQGSDDVLVGVVAEVLGSTRSTSAA